MDTPQEKMDKVIPKKTGLQKKHIGYIAGGLAVIVLIYMAFFADRTSTYKVEKDKLIIETVTEDKEALPTGNVPEISVKVVPEFVDFETASYFMA